MKKIIQDPSGKATVAESCDLALNAGVIIQKSNIDDAYLNQKAQLLATKGDEMKVSIAADRSKEKTDELVALDNKRDACISALKLLTRGYMAWHHNDQSVLAERIYEIIKKHGLNMAKENYEEESALVESMLNDLALPANQEAITTLNMGGVATDLREAQTAFSNVYRESAAIEANKESIVAATAIKRETRAILIETINFLNAMAIANSEVYGSVAAEMAEIVNALNQKIRTRNNN